MFAGVIYRLVGMCAGICIGVYQVLTGRRHVEQRLRLMLDRFDDIDKRLDELERSWA